MRRIDDTFLRSLACVALLATACGGSEANGNAAEAGESAVAASAEAGEATPAAAGGAPSAPTPAKQDDRPDAPDFALPDLAGETVTMAELRGKIVVVDFWATWCPPCLFQIPILNAIQEKHAADVVVVGVAVDVEGLEVVKPYAVENDIQYTIVIGTESLARKFGAPGFPALALVTPTGKIASMHVGLIEEDVLTAEISEIRGEG